MHGCREEQRWEKQTLRWCPQGPWLNTDCIVPPAPHRGNGTAQFHRISQKYRYSILFKRQSGKNWPPPPRTYATDNRPARPDNAPPACRAAATFAPHRQPLRFLSLNRMNKPLIWSSTVPPALPAAWSLNTCCNATRRQRPALGHGRAQCRQARRRARRAGRPPTPPGGDRHHQPRQPASADERHAPGADHRGPYQLYGNELVAACAASGGLCGPVRRARLDAPDDRRAEATAKASGARIVFSCGFDPSRSTWACSCCKRNLPSGPRRPPRARPGAQDEGRLLRRHRRQPQSHHGRSRQPARCAGSAENPFSLTPGFEGPRQPSGHKPMVDEAWAMGGWHRL